MENKDIQGKILDFNKENDGCWYIDLPNWPLSHHNLMMVCGADDLCEHLSSDGKSVTVGVVINPKKKPNSEWGKLVKTKSSLLGGATYKVKNIKGFNQDIWLCPVTLFVFGKYPDVIYINKIH